MRVLRIILLSLPLLACSGIDLEEVNPQGVDLTGTWILDEGASDSTDGLRSKQRRRSDNQVVERRREIVRAAGSGLAFVTHDFQVLTADRITIEQNHDSVGIAHKPGVYRDVSWGERQRGLWEVYAGWENSDLVIISKAPDLSVFERYKAARQKLVVEVTIEADGDNRTINRVFTRR